MTSRWSHLLSWASWSLMTLSLVSSALGSALQSIGLSHASTARRVVIYGAWLTGSALLVGVPRHRTVAAIGFVSIIVLYATPVVLLACLGRATSSWLLNATILIAPLVQSACLMWIARALMIEGALPRFWRAVVLGAALLGALSRSTTTVALCFGSVTYYAMGKRAANLTMLAMCTVAAVISALLLRGTSRRFASPPP